MSISPELFLAILSMDAYNRGYEAGIEDKVGVGDGLGRVGSRIGSAIVTADAQDPNGIAQAAGFYAVAYVWNGQTVISYRGTDSLFQWENLIPWSDAPGGDIRNSYALGAGSSLPGS